MGLYDALTLTSEKTEWTTLLSGSYSVSMGDTLSSFIGAGRQTHIVGDEIKYVFDWESFLELGHVPILGSLLEVLPVNALLGEGGNMTWTFGRKTDLHYLGPSVTIKRAGSVSATSKSNFFAADDQAKDKDFKGTAEEWAVREKLATYTGVITALLSAAMIAINTGAEVVARVKYQDQYKKSDKEAVEKMVLFCTISLLLTTRMMYLIKSIELFTAFGQRAIGTYYESLSKLHNVAAATALAILSDGLGDDIENRLDEASESASKFAERLKFLKRAWDWVSDKFKS
ncbi:hypothetical protein [Gemmata sp.]|uniref:hypothetical protein n=1 Tax=Gemmata sp. TaxID=1914242 RepID=UPI003F70E154